MDLHNNEVGRRIAVENPDAGREELRHLSFLLSLSIIALIAGCGVNLGGVSVEFDAMKSLVELVPGDWDTVHILVGPATRERIERDIGRPVELSGSGV